MGTGEDIYGNKKTGIGERFVAPFISLVLSIITSFVKLPVNSPTSKTISSPEFWRKLGFG